MFLDWLESLGFTSNRQILAALKEVKHDMATLKEKVDALVAAALSYKDQVGPLQAAVTALTDKYDAYVVAEDAEDVSQNAERDSLKAELAAAVDEVKAANDAVDAATADLTGAAEEVPVEEVPETEVPDTNAPVEGDVEAPAESDNSAGNDPETVDPTDPNPAPVASDSPADAANDNAPTDEVATEDAGVKRDEFGNPVV